jgi:integrase
MVVKVRMDGLNIVRSRGKFYVYIRGTKKRLLAGFEGSRADLMRRLEQDDMRDLYHALRVRDLKRTYPDGTLGALIQWFENDCRRFANLSEATKRDYRAAYQYLQPEWGAPLESITQPSLYDVQEKAAKAKWPRFADQLIAALSSMFTQAVKRHKMAMNPAKGIEKASKADPNANREWTADEVAAALADAPHEIKTPLMLARYAGFRGQTIAALPWKAYQADPRFGKCFRHIAKKNDEASWIPAAPELQAYLDGLDRTALKIATRNSGQPWDSEKQMQWTVSHFLRSLEEAGKIGAGTTLHGLRVTYAADLKRTGGASDGDIAAALGDRSDRMGTHYTRHVEAENKVIRAFSGKRKKDGS